jgi:3-dehydroquinate dehydratase-2
LHSIVINEEILQKLFIINGPNLNLLGSREPDVYGNLSLDEIIDYTERKLEELGCNCIIEWFQSNSEGVIIDMIHKLISLDYNALIINPGAYSHTSIAIHDALKILSIPKIEVHLSNTQCREEFRKTKITGKACDMIIEGGQKNAYFLGIMSQL